MDHKQKLKAFVSDYKALGEAAALADLDFACQAALHHMRKGDEMAMLRADNLRNLPIMSRPYYKKELQDALSEIGHFSVELNLKTPSTDTLWISWV